jgi:hypothetical protein
MMFMLVLTLATSCAETDEGLGPDEIAQRYNRDSITTTPVVEPYVTTDQPYDFTGDMPIGDLAEMIDFSESVWYGLSPIDQRPNPDQACGTFDNPVVELPDLPARIEGIVTLHPRFFEKIGFCGSDERYYGSYFLQDSSGGIQVLKDSRIADFDVGDRVSIRVRGLMQEFGAGFVLLHDEETVISKDHPVYLTDAERFLVPDHIGKAVRIRGKIVQPPTNFNFNNACLIPPDSDDTRPCDPRCVSSEQCQGYILAAFDREIGQRNPDPIEVGDVLEMRGPVIDGFDDLTIQIAEEGQYDIIE